MEEFHELLAESGYTCACALKPCSESGIFKAIVLRLGSNPVVPNTIQAPMAAIAGGMAIQSWEAQSVQCSTDLDLEDLDDLGSGVQLLAMLVLSGTQVSEVLKCLDLTDDEML